MSEHKIQFGTLQPDGTLTNRRAIKQTDVMACQFSILMPEHYRENGSCRCDDPDHRKMMIATWGYSAKDFSAQQAGAAEQSPKGASK